MIVKPLAKEDANIASTTYVGSVEEQAIIFLLDNPSHVLNDKDLTIHVVSEETSEMGSGLHTINPLLNDSSLYQRLSSMHELSQFKRAVGSTYSSGTIYLADDDLLDTTSPEHHEIEHMDVQQIHDSLYQHSKEGTINVDDIMVSAIHARRHQGVKPPHLAKIWRIDKNTAKRTLDITSQRSVRTDNPKLSCNYGTNDRMLRYKHLNEHFFMDTLFATSKAKKSLRGHTCAQLFVTDKGFV